MDRCKKVSTKMLGPIKKEHRVGRTSSFSNTQQQRPNFAPPIEFRKAAYALIQKLYEAGHRVIPGNNRDFTVTRDGIMSRYCKDIDSLNAFAEILCRNHALSDPVPSGPKPFSEEPPMSTPISYAPGDLSEQAGHHTAYTALEAMRRERAQGARLEILIDALTDIFGTSSGHERAIAGFAVGLIATLDNGLGVNK